MQTDDVKQSARLRTTKKVLWWLLGTMVAVPITKWVETQLSLSFFSPAISGLWNWILSVGGWFGQSAPMPLWMLLAITVYALLMTGAFLWAVIDANKQLDAADVELGAAHSRITELERPSLPPAPDPLNESQLKVMLAVSAYVEAHQPCRVKEFPRGVGLSQLLAETAIDVLEQRGLIKVHYATSGKYIALTAEGREYLVSEDFSSLNTIISPQS